MSRDEKQAPQIGDLVHVRGGCIGSTARTLLDVVQGGFKVSDTLSGSIIVSGVEHYRPGPEPIGDKVSEIGGLTGEHLDLLHRLTRRGYWAELGEGFITVHDPIRLNAVAIQFRPTKLPACDAAVTKFLIQRS